MMNTVSSSIQTNRPWNDSTLLHRDLAVNRSMATNRGGLNTNDMLVYQSLNQESYEQFKSLDTSQETNSCPRVNEAMVAIGSPKLSTNIGSLDIV